MKMIAGEVKMPSGQIDKALIKDNRDGTVSIQYEPREEGLHELHIRYNSEHVQGSSFIFAFYCILIPCVIAFVDYRRVAVQIFRRLAGHWLRNCLRFRPDPRCVWRGLQLHHLDQERWIWWLVAGRRRSQQSRDQLQ